MDLLAHQFKTADVVRATGISYPSVQAWLSRGYFDLPGQAKPGTGQPRLFKALSVIQLAIARELVDRYGMKPEDASKIAVFRGLTTRFDRTHEPDLKGPMPFLENPTGLELATVFLDGTGNPRIEEGVSINPETDFSRTTKSAIVLAVGAIAKATLETLNTILLERDPS